MNHTIKILATLLYTAIAFASQNLPEENNWKTQEGFARMKHLCQDSGITDLFPNNPQGLIKGIFVRKNDKGASSIYIQLNQDNFKQSEIAAACKDLKIRFTQLTSSVTLSNPTECNEGLAYFYYLNAIPDFIIDYILELKIFNIEDFRTNAAKIIKMVEQKFNLNTQQNHPIEISEADLRDCIFDQLKLIPNPLNHQSACNDIIKYLINEMPDCRSLIRELCELITDKNLPIYATAKLIIAEDAIAQGHSPETPIEVYYNKPIISLLESMQAVTISSDNNMLLNSTVNSFANNGKLSAASPELSNLTVSAETVFNLLNIIRQQKETIERLSSAKE